MNLHFFQTNLTEQLSTIRLASKWDILQFDLFLTSISLRLNLGVLENKFIALQRFNQHKLQTTVHKKAKL